jgi:hypothetical protein
MEEIKETIMAAYSNEDKIELIERLRNVLNDMEGEVRAELSDETPRVLEDQPISDDDKVMVAVNRAINNFATSGESFKIENMTPDYVPIAVDKIFEMSKDVTIFDRTGELLRTYADVIEAQSKNLKKITVYASGSNPLPPIPSIDFRSISLKSEFPKGSHEMRYAIIGDNLRYRVETFEEVPHLTRLQNMFRKLIGVRSKEIPPVQYESITDFHNNIDALKVLKSVEQIVGKAPPAHSL